MLFWLDNKDNHRDAVNENYGRELLELFSMGVGNYTERDVRQCSHAFTGWTIRNAPLHTARVARDSVWPYGRLDWQFEYRADDHDASDKTFLGHTGAFERRGGHRHHLSAASHRPISSARHLYNFFVADEPPVPSWPTIPPRDPEAITTLMQAFVDSGYELRASVAHLVQRRLFQARSLRQSQKPSRDGGQHRAVRRWVSTSRPWTMWPWHSKTNAMGQQLLDPPSVEGWHTGKEWINTASLMTRVNFARATVCRCHQARGQDHYRRRPGAGSQRVS